MNIIKLISKEALRKDIVVKKDILNNKLIIRPLTKPPMIIEQSKGKINAKELSSLINSKTGC
jgi:hypothetical protein